MAKLSDREKKAKQLGVAVNYKVSASKQGAPKVAYNMSKGTATVLKPTIKPAIDAQTKALKGYSSLPKGMYGPVAPKAILAKNYVTAQKKGYDTVSQEKGMSGPAMPYDLYKKKQRQINDEEADKYKKEAEQAKSETGLKGLYKKAKEIIRPTYGLSADEKSKYKTTLVMEGGKPVVKKAEKKVSLVDKAKSAARVGGELLNIIPQVGGYIGQKIADATGNKKYSEKVSKAREKYGVLAEKVLSPKTEAQKVAQSDASYASNFIGGFKAATGLVKPATTRVLKTASEKGAGFTTKSKILAQGEKGAFESVGNTMSGAKLRTGSVIGAKTAKASGEESRMAKLSNETPNEVPRENIPGKTDKNVPVKKSDGTNVERVDVESGKSKIKESQERVRKATDDYNNSSKDEFGNVHTDIKKSFDDAIRAEDGNTRKAYKDVTGEDLPEGTPIDEVLRKLEEFGVKNERRFKLQDSEKMSSREALDNRSVGRPLKATIQSPKVGLLRRGKLGNNVVKVSKEGKVVKSKAEDPLLQEAGNVESQLKDVNRQLFELGQRANLTSSEQGIAKITAERARLESIKNSLESKLPTKVQESVIPFQQRKDDFLASLRDTPSEVDTNVLPGETAAQRDYRVNWRKDMEMQKNTTPKFANGEKVVTKEGRPLILKSFWIENGKVKYDAYTPGKKASNAHQFSVFEKDLTTTGKKQLNATYEKTKVPGSLGSLPSDSDIRKLGATIKNGASEAKGSTSEKITRLETDLYNKAQGEKGLLTKAREARIQQKAVQSGLVRGERTSGESVLDSFLTQSRTPNTVPKGKKVSPPTIQNPRVSPSWVSKIGTSIREVVQDNWVRVKNLQKEVGTEINSKDLTPYQAETLMHGRTQARLDAVKEAVKGIDEEVVKLEKLDPQARKKIDLYLTAKHAPERNALHSDGAAGMTNAEAESILKEIGDNKEIKAVAQKMKDMNDQTLEILRDSQVISEEAFNTLRQSYKEHVPLQRIMDDTDMNEYLAGKGLDVRSSGVKRAVGSDREVADILTNITANLEQAVVRAEKNRVNLATLKFAREHKELGIFEEFSPKIVGKKIDFGAREEGMKLGDIPTKDQYVFEQVNDPNVLTVMENGKPVHLRIKDERLASAFKAVGQEKLPPLFNFIGAFTRLYSGLATRFNPEFAFSNKLRDLQEMAVYMAAQKEVGFSGATKTAARDIVSMADVTAGMMGKNTEGGKLYRQMVEDGGTTGGMALSTRKQLEIDIESIRNMNRSGMFNVRKNGEKFLKVIDSWNEVFENSSRLSVYKTALDKGMTRDQAAYLAKNATINFNKKGTGGGIINSLYMFSNASIQGTTKLLGAMKNPKVAAAVTASVGSAVWATNEWNDRVDPDWREKVDKWDRESNLIVALPTGEGVKYMTIPVSWGLKPMKVMADYGYDAINGKANQTTGFQVAGNVMGSVWNAYNPVGGSSIGSSIVPTIGDVPYDIATNTKWSGSMMRPDSKEGVPESENFFKNKEGVPSDKSGMFGLLRKGTAKLADATNGNVQVNPASLKYAIDSYLSGAGRAVSGTLETIKAIGPDKELQTKDTPFVRRFLKEKTPEELAKTTKYSEKDTFISDLKKLPREQQPEKIQEYIKSLNPEERKGAAYGLNLEGFNTKGVSTSDDVIKFKPVAQEYAKILDNGGDADAYLRENLKSPEDVKAYGKGMTSYRDDVREEYSSDIQKMADIYQSDYKSEELRKFAESLPPSKKETVINAIVKELDKREGKK